MATKPARCATPESEKSRVLLGSSHLGAGHVMVSSEMAEQVRLLIRHPSLETFGFRMVFKVGRLRSDTKRKRILQPS